MSAPAGEAALLDVERLSLSFGGLKAVQDFSLHLPPQALYGLIGPNGAGKTTVFNLLTGVYRPDAGKLKLDGRDLTGREPHKITAAGIARTFQNVRLFGDLTVLDNVRIGGQLRGRHRLIPTLLRTRHYRQQEADIRARALELLALFGLEHRAHELARVLSYGHQRQLEIIRALGTGPRVLLLDEPAAGMNPQEKLALADAIRHIRDQFHVAILLIDHDMGLVMRICERITVLDHGVMIAEGTPEHVQNHPQVIAAYLGVET
jgi:branched-chain amino acid transport system ATP-binding protein